MLSFNTELLAYLLTKNSNSSGSDPGSASGPFNAVPATHLQITNIIPHARRTAVKRTYGPLNETTENDGTGDGMRYSIPSPVCNTDTRRRRGCLTLPAGERVEYSLQKNYVCCLARPYDSSFVRDFPNDKRQNSHFGLCNEQTRLAVSPTRGLAFGILLTLPSRIHASR